MHEGHYVEYLLDDANSVEDKAKKFSEYLSENSSVISAKGYKGIDAVKYGISLLGEAAGMERVEDIIVVIKQLTSLGKKNKKALCQELKSIKPGTPVVINNGKSQIVVRFKKMNRTRFIAEFPDGLEYSVPVIAFVEVHVSENQSIQDIS